MEKAAPVIKRSTNQSAFAAMRCVLESRVSCDAFAGPGTWLRFSVHRPILYRRLRLSTAGNSVSIFRITPRIISYSRSTRDQGMGMASRRRRRRAAMGRREPGVPTTERSRQWRRRPERKREAGERVGRRCERKVDYSPLSSFPFSRRWMRFSFALLCFLLHFIIQKKKYIVYLLDELVAMKARVLNWIPEEYK